MVTQWFKTEINSKEFVNVGIVDETDSVKRGFYLKKMLGILQKQKLIVKVTNTEHPVTKNVQVHLFAKSPELKTFKFMAWIHPKGGGDDYQVKGQTRAENEEEAKKQISAHLKKKKSMITNDFYLIP